MENDRHDDFHSKEEQARNQRSQTHSDTKSHNAINAPRMISFILAGVSVFAFLLAIVVVTTATKAQTSPATQVSGAFECFCSLSTTGMPRLLANSILASRTRFQILGVTVAGTKTEIVNLAHVLTNTTCLKNITKGKPNRIQTVFINEKNHDTELGPALLTPSVDPSSSCRLVVLEDINKLPKTTLSMLKSLLNFRSWKGKNVVPEVTMVLVGLGSSSGLGKKDMNDRKKLFDSVIEKRVLDDRVVHMMTHVAVS